MIKVSLIFIILCIIIYQFYQNSKEDKSNLIQADNNEEKEVDSTKLNQINVESNQEVNQSNIQGIDEMELNQEVNQSKLLQNSADLKVASPKQVIKQTKKIMNSKSNNKNKMVPNHKDTWSHPIYGKPTKVLKQGYYFKINNPYPWDSLVFNDKMNPSTLYMINLSPMLNFQPKDVIVSVCLEWSRYFETQNVNIALNTNTFELILPSNDENIAITICNLLLNCIKGDLDLRTIIKNKLIEISVVKIKSYPVVKKKIIDQILSTINGSELIDTQSNTPAYEEDLAIDNDITKKTMDTVDNSESSSHPTNEQVNDGSILPAPKDLFEINNVDGFGAFDNSFGSSYSMI